jgi:hypothetical protein
VRIATASTRTKDLAHRVAGRLVRLALSVCLLAGSLIEDLLSPLDRVDVLAIQLALEGQLLFEVCLRGTSGDGILAVEFALKSDPLPKASLRCPNRILVLAHPRLHRPALFQIPAPLVGGTLPVDLGFLALELGLKDALLPEIV